MSSTYRDLKVTQRNGAVAVVTRRRALPPVASVLAGVLLVGVLLVGALLVGASPGRAVADETAARVGQVEEAVADAVDAERTGAGVPPLAHVAEMDEVAREFAAQLGREGGLRHNPDALADLRAQGLETNAVSEIVGWATVRSTPEEEAEALMRAWLASSSHRARIHDDDRTHTGVGAAYAGGRVYVVVVFARDAQRPAVRAALTDDVTGASHAVVGRSDDPADALAAGPLVGNDGVIAFVDPPRGADDAGPPLPRGVAEHLERALDDGATVYIAGGAAAVGTRAERELDAAGFDVRRLAGDDRAATAAEIAREVVAHRGEPDHVVIAGGHDWPDAVAGGLWAATEGVPVLLVDGDEVPDPTAEALERFEGAERVVVGGGDVVAESVVRALDARRVDGVDRYATSSSVASSLFDPEADVLLLALGHGRGAVWGHALGLTRVAADERAALLLVHPDDGLRAPVASALSARERDPREVLLAEGVDPALIDEVEALASP